jgi:hypothetical protein
MKYIIFCTLLPLMLLSACVKDYRDVETPSFDVHVDSVTYGINKPIYFRVTGSADRVTFYSGEPGRDYGNKDRITVTGTPQIQFTSLRQFGLNNTVPDTTLRVLVSTDFANEVDLVRVQAATWTDISSRAVLSNGPATATVFVPSGVIDLSDFYKPDVPVYIAFKFQDIRSAVSQRTWTVKDIKIDTKLEDGSLVSIATSATLNWGVLNVSGTAQWSYTTAQIAMAGGAANSIDNTDWIVSQPLFLNRVKRDAGVSIRSNVKSLLTDYVFAGYTKPGTYTAVFEAYNATQWDNKQTLKKITFTIK